jgi:M6 family metalloprotease-like protein
VCAGGAEGVSTSTQPPDQVAAKPAGRLHQGQRNALVIFAAFADDVAWQEVPTWGAQLLDPSLPGSLSHFYDTMSLDALHVGGEVGPRVYHARHDASYYRSAEPTQEGKFGEFSLEILAAADAEVDFSRFDNDGPDGIPSSGDDDGLVDAVFIVIANAPANFIIGPATGRGALGNWKPYTTDDQGQGGQPTRVSPDQGTIQQGATFAEAVGSMCHEFGHLLGLPDLFDTAYFRDSDATPEQDSAGIGAWGLMGWGALGWKGTPGPTSLSAWSRQRLGWAEVLRPEGIEVTVEMEQVGAAGQVYWVPLSGQDYLLLEYRRRSSTFYDRGIPAEGLLVWHVGRQVYQGEVTPWWKVDLECADGLWADAGFPLGEVANADGGGDNLDFWAHDATYTARHGGNLGDATDPFDGVRYRSFTPDTNPPATSSDGAHGIHLTEITIAGDRLSAQLRMSPPAVELTFLAPVAERVAAGGRVAINFHVANTGGSPATALRAELSTESDLLEILDPSLEDRGWQRGDQRNLVRVRVRSRSAG